MSEENERGGLVPWSELIQPLPEGERDQPEPEEVVRSVLEGELLPVCSVAGCSVVGRPGEVMCDGHAAQQRIMSAQRKLAAATPAAADQLIDLAVNGKTEDVRRRASEAVLDRAGIRPGVEVTLTERPDGTPDVAAILRERLSTLRARTLEHQEDSDPAS